MTAANRFLRGKSMSMDFVNRIKKEMAEGIVRAILEDAGYRVIDSGIEKVLRELSCLSHAEYSALGYPDALSRLPDFTVMNREQNEKFLVEVKYRSDWGRAIFDEVRDQAKIFGELTLVSINAGAQSLHAFDSPSLFIRGCRLRFQGDQYQLHQRSKRGDAISFDWVSVDTLEDESSLWWSMTPLHEIFSKVGERRDSQTLQKAVACINGILR
ncbi:hypothetical protein [Dyella sedimenti]|uniref:hypothetical protein n=1 Tax=Dyella sedimenti TaxID=2919947 RepID=UPI001FA99A0C|nr:hypothetical protein [Dyella sedimenti]